MSKEAGRTDVVNNDSTQMQPGDRGKPHNALFRKVFSDPARAAAELQAILPPEIVRQVRWDTLALEDGSFVNDKLRDLYSDLLFKANLTEGGEALIYLLFEHQSTTDWRMARRLLEYEVNIWKKWEEEHPEARKIPAIFPVVLYHGDSRWTPAREFLSLIDLPPGVLELWRQYLPAFKYEVESLPEQPDEVLFSWPVPAAVKLVLLVFKYGRTGRQVLERLSEWRELVTEAASDPLGREVFIWSLVYLFQVSKVEPEEVGECLAGTPAVKEAVMTTAQRLFEEGRQKGRLEGRQEGLEEGNLAGQRRLLLKQLRLRFGSIPRPAMARINKASSEQLERWAERLLTAPSLQKVLVG